jgi:hypothetical protein
MEIDGVAVTTPLNVYALLATVVVDEGDAADGVGAADIVAEPGVAVASAEGEPDKDAALDIVGAEWVDRELTLADCVGEAVLKGEPVCDAHALALAVPEVVWATDAVICADTELLPQADA